MLAERLLYALVTAPLPPGGRPRGRLVRPDEAWTEIRREGGPTWLVAGRRSGDEAARALWAVLGSERPDRQPVTVVPEGQPLPDRLPVGERVVWEVPPPPLGFGGAAGATTPPGEAGSSFGTRTADPSPARSTGGWRVERLVRQEVPSAEVGPVQVRGDDGRLSHLISVALPDRPGPQPLTVLPVEPPPGVPLCDLDPAAVQRQIDAALDSLDARRVPGPMLVVVTADALVGRPRSGPAAAVAGAAIGWARAFGARVLEIGPLDPRERPPRVLGVAPLGPTALGSVLRAAVCSAAPRLVAIDARWREVVTAFPHLAPLVTRTPRG